MESQAHKLDVLSDLKIFNMKTANIYLSFMWQGLSIWWVCLSQHVFEEGKSVIWHFMCHKMIVPYWLLVLFKRWKWLINKVSIVESRACKAEIEIKSWWVESVYFLICCLLQIVNFKIITFSDLQCDAFIHHLYINFVLVNIYLLEWQPWGIFLQQRQPSYHQEM